MEKCSNKRPMTLLVPWWETSGVHSTFSCDCPSKSLGIPHQSVRKMDGWNRWVDNEKSPGKHNLSRSVKSHVRKYA